MKCLLKKYAPRNILWKKSKSKNSDHLFIDIFKIKNNVIHLSPIEAQFDTVKTNVSQKNDSEARILREEGKEFFADGKYENAMKKFNHSLRLAENGSEEVGLAYANRSSCFFSLKLLDECMVDLKLANKSNYPEHLMPKLENRTVQCTILMRNTQFKSEFVVREPILSFSEHTKYVGVADCLEIWADAAYGRHIIATRDLDVGQTILVEKAFSIVPTKYMNMGRDRCVNCFKEFRNFITCRNCINSRFCYDGCMEESYHNLNCNLPIPQAQPELSQMVLEILFKVNEAFPDVDMLMKTVEALLNGEEADDLTNVIQRDFCLIFQLITNHEKRSDEQIEELRNACAIIFTALMNLPEFNLKFTKMKHARFLQHLIFHLLHISENSVDLYQYFQEDENTKLMSCTFQPYAYGIYPIGCQINHNCVPNIAYFSIDDRLVCKVIRPIRKGGQIFRSYSGQYSMQQNPIVIAELDSRYHFKCDCFICSNSIWSQLAGAVDCTQDILYVKAIEPIFMTAQEVRDLSSEQIENYEKKSIEFLEKYDTIHPVNDTIAIQKTLQIMWALLASKFPFPNESISNNKH